MSSYGLQALATTVAGTASWLVPSVSRWPAVATGCIKKPCRKSSMPALKSLRDFGRPERVNKRSFFATPRRARNRKHCAMPRLFVGCYSGCGLSAAAYL